MILQSINKKKIYFLIYNPFKQTGVMPIKNTCLGCTHHEFIWDKLERTYSHYCNLFGVWHPDGPKPNKICLYHLRDKN